jgi:hypothetical protein
VAWTHSRSKSAAPFPKSLIQRQSNIGCGGAGQVTRKRILSSCIDDDSATVGYSKQMSNEAIDSNALCGVLAEKLTFGPISTQRIPLRPDESK